MAAAIHSAAPSAAETAAILEKRDVAFADGAYAPRRTSTGPAVTSNTTYGSIAAFDSGALTSEKLTQLYLARIEAYDKAGPKINAVITLNAEALATARALDAERKTKGPRSPLHGTVAVARPTQGVFDVDGWPELDVGVALGDVLAVAAPARRDDRHRGTTAR